LITITSHCHTMHHHAHTSPTSTTLNNHHDLSAMTQRGGSNDKEGRVTTRWGEQRQSGEQQRRGESNDEGVGAMAAHPQQWYVIDFNIYSFILTILPLLCFQLFQRNEGMSPLVTSNPCQPPPRVWVEVGKDLTQTCYYPTPPTPTSVSHFERRRVCSAPPPPSLSCFE